jgi:HSP20 family protein
VRRRTRLVGRFRHEIVLPGDVDENGVKASVAEGVLTIRVPTTAADWPVSITVE